MAMEQSGISNLSPAHLCLCPRKHLQSVEDCRTHPQICNKNYNQNHNIIEDWLEIELPYQLQSAIFTRDTKPTEPLFLGHVINT